MPSPIDLSTFRKRDFDRGAGSLKELCWLLARSALFERSNLPWYRLRRLVLRLFGADMAEGVVVKAGVKIAFPWKLSVGAHSWLGEDAWLANFDRITIGANVCVSQRALLCTGNHDWSDPAFGLVTKPIVVRDGAWICANVFVAPGVTIGENAVATAGSVVTRDLPSGMICSGNPCVPVKARVVRASAAQH